MTEITENAPDAPNWLLYDGECPFCTAYVKLVRLRDNVGSISLINARDRDAAYQEAIAADFDLDEGMLLKLSGKYYHGKDCIHVLAMLSGETTLFSRFSGWVFRSQRRSAALYPVLRFGRNTVIRALGRKPLRADGSQTELGESSSN